MAKKEKGGMGLPVTVPGLDGGQTGHPLVQTNGVKSGPSISSPKIKNRV